VPRLQASRILLLALFALSGVLPGVHLLEGHGRCAACHDRLGGGAPSIGCRGSCNDPTHHHHPGHDGSACPTCRLSHSLKPFPAQAAVRVLAPSASPLQRPAVPVRPSAADIRLAPARAPPAATSG
jgi:hypothetical protein